MREMGVFIFHIFLFLDSFAMYTLKQRHFFRANIYVKLNLNDQKHIWKLQSKLEMKQIPICWLAVEFVIQASDCNL